MKVASAFFTIILLFKISNSSSAIERDQTLFYQGKTVYEKVCIVYHNDLPLPKNAPPLLGISGHYH